MFVRDYLPKEVPPPTKEIRKVKYEVERDIPEDIGEPTPGRYQYSDGMYSRPDDGSGEFTRWGIVSNNRQYVAFHKPRSRAPKAPEYTDEDFYNGLKNVHS